MKTAALVVSCALALAACKAVVPDLTYNYMAPWKAVELAALYTPDGIDGTFDLLVENTGVKDGYVFLNSESDFRDQRNLSIAIGPKAVQALTVTLKGPPQDTLRGKRVRVKGTAKRLQVYFVRDGKPTEHFLYQTYVNVDDPAQIQVAP